MESYCYAAFTLFYIYSCLVFVRVILPAAGWHVVSPPPALPPLTLKVNDAQDQLAERIDWVIQESTLEGMHPWASAVFAHSSYFANFDMVMFLVNRLNEGLEEEEKEEKTEVKREEVAVLEKEEEAKQLAEA